MYRTLKLSSRL